MRNPVPGARFRRDVNLVQKRGKDLAKLREVILLLIEGSPLQARCKDHPLAGDWKHYRECHIEPDWLLSYKIDGSDLHLVRTERTRTCSEWSHHRDRLVAPPIS